jgi:GIY-YIG catalytic domain
VRRGRLPLGRVSVVMELTDLLRKSGIDPKTTLVFRHRPMEPRLNEFLPLLAAEKPDVFNAYQQTQGEKAERAMLKASHLASFIRHGPGKALFVALYSITGSRSLTRGEFWRLPANIELKGLGMTGISVERGRPSCLCFDLAPTEFYESWKGKLVVGWPPPERSWYRRAHKNSFPILAVLDESALVPALEWTRVFRWAELDNLPRRWQDALSQWRGIYYIFDALDGKGYVGSAYGGDNLLGRWRNYAASGHGGNALLRKRNPRTFEFSILQRLAPDADAEGVILIEGTWKERLHTRRPHGLNDN